MVVLLDIAGKAGATLSRKVSRARPESENADRVSALLPDGIRL